MRDLTGKVFGRLTVLKRGDDYVSPKGVKRPAWECICVCGNTKTIVGMSLTNGDSRSCGCYSSEIARQTTHGLTKSPTYHSWAGMKSRCDNPKDSSYEYYGGRGITYSDRWKDFGLFLEDMGLKPKGTSLNRVDNNGSYCKENCNWATGAEQARNTSRSRKVTLNGSTKNIIDVAAEYSIPSRTLYERSKVLSIEQALSHPKYKRYK